MHRLYIDFDSSADAKEYMQRLIELHGPGGGHIDYIPAGTPDLLAFQIAAAEGRRAISDTQYRIESITNRAGRIIGYRRTR